MKMQPNGVKQNIKSLLDYGNRKGESRTIKFDRNFRLQQNPMAEKITNRLTFSDQGKKNNPIEKSSEETCSFQNIQWCKILTEFFFFS